MRVIAFMHALVFWYIFTSAAAQSSTTELSEANVYSDAELFKAICDRTSVIWIRADLDLREENWPTGCKAPVVLNHNMTISGPLDEALNYTVSFNFMARKVVIQRYGEVRLRRFTARNTRRGGGGEIDFIAFSPGGILWTDDLNKNQITCLHTDTSKLVVLPLPVNFPEFANRSQKVQLWDTYCTPRQCWKEVLHYDEFFTDVNVGSDSETGGYVMAKNNASKTCDSFVTDECLRARGGEACMMDVIDAFLADLQRSPSGRVRPAAIAVPVAVGGAALIVAIIAAVQLYRRRRRRLDAEAAAAAKLYGTGADLESGGGGATATGGRGRRDRIGSKGVDSRSSDSKDGVSGGSSSDDPRGGSPAVAGAENVDGRGTEDSFGYATVDDMGRGLSGRRHAPGSPYALASSGGAASGTALVEGVMQDGSVCSFAVGSPLGQGSFGVVFKGMWQEKPVAVKLILCDPHYAEQVATEVRLMTSEACRHPNLLRAYAYMTRSKVVNKQQPGGQALQSTIRGLVSSSNRRHAVSRHDGEQTPPRGPDSYGIGGGARSSCSGSTEQLAETWIVSEYCDLGALAPHVHTAKRFLFPLDNPPPSAPATAPNTAANTAAGTAAASLDAAGALGGDGAGGGAAAAAPLRRPRLSLILSVLRDISRGMAHLHSLNTVHGDLKMANVLLSTRPLDSEADVSSAAAGAEALPRNLSEGSSVAVLAGSAGLSSALNASGPLGQLPPDVVAKVADFGLSRMLKEGQTHHSTKTVGTVTHMPPELLRNGKLTLSGDVYSFGIIMWELLTGSVPYKGQMYGEVVERVVVSHRRPEFPEHTPPAYRSLAERCWSADAASRPTFSAVLAEVESMLAHADGLQAESDMLYGAARR